MHYHEVIVGRSFGPLDDGLLTYQSNEAVPIGSLVIVELKDRKVPALVWRNTRRPNHPTKPIDRILPVAPLPEAYRQLISWLSEYYACGLSLALQTLLPPRLESWSGKQAAEPAVVRPPSIHQPPLTGDQKRVLATIRRSSQQTHILHAETGSGKTRIYSELAAETLASGKHVLILVPEIALSTQTQQQLAQSLGLPLQSYHSQLTGAARRAHWLQAASGEPRVWLGTRSALFLPLDQLGLIVIDEAHDQSYKQDNAPRYHARSVAAKLAQLHSAKLVLGSATPSLNDVYYAEQKKVPTHRIKRAINPPLTAKLELVDMRNRTPSKTPWLSQIMLDGLSEAMSRGEQAIVFLNRRGSASMVLCPNCGWQALCPHCALPQTFHADTHERRCHVCNRREPMPMSCPECHQPELLLKGCGTKEIEQLLLRYFPKARVARLDRDSFKAADFTETYETMRRGNVDIMVGTQMLAKGFDLPGVTFVGIVHADAGLSLPDFAAGERTFQLLYQVVGRGGRGGKHNHVVVQSYRPDHPTIKAALDRDWEAFYGSELAARRQGKFPPFRFALKIICRQPSDAAAQRRLDKLVATLPKGVTALGPSPAFHARSGGQRVWSLVCFSSQRSQLVELARRLPAGCYADLDPVDLL